jgi:Brp/Blh family beta-carotene 15,15'-monooxygenase
VRASRFTHALLVSTATAVTVGATASGSAAISGVLDMVAIGAILLLGLPHGALDLIALGRDAEVEASRWAILAVYLFLLVGSAALWFLSPALALIGFLVVSIVHFASEWQDQLPPVVAWPAAALVIALPASTHPVEVADLFAALAGDRIVAGTLVTVAGWTAIPLALGLVAGLLSVRTAQTERVMLTALGLAGTTLHPLHAFAIFFALVHAPRHMVSEAATLGERLGAAWVLAIPMTIAAVLMFAGMWYGIMRSNLAAAAFTLLAILAIPHMFSRQALRLVARLRKLGTDMQSDQNEVQRLHH